MSSTIITVLRCDRCGHQAEIRQTSEAEGWGKFAARSTGFDRTREIGTGPVGDDLCPGCADLLFAWFASPGAVAQPAPPAPRPRPVFTLEDRRDLTPILRVALVAQVEETGAAYRDAPTMALHPEVPPIALAGVDDRADALARQILEQLEASRS